MCGISGIVQPVSSNADSILKSLEAIKHRGPDDTHITAISQNEPVFYSCHFSSEFTKQKFPPSGSAQANTWIGFNRLAIIDCSNQAALPLYDAEQDCLFYMNGEIYNYRELRKNHLSETAFNTDSDTEVAFRLYLKLGDNYIQHLRGMFAIVAVRPKLNQIKIWRDRFGIKPLFYAASPKHFIFSSEAGGIHATGLVPASFDWEQLAQQFYLGSSNSPETIYKELRSLEPASCLTFNTNDFTYQITHYWSLAYNPRLKDTTPAEFLHDTSELARLSLSGVDGTKKSVMLSGGLDSGLLAILLAKESNTIDACTIYTDNSHELPYTRINAEKAGLNLTEFLIPEQTDSQNNRLFSLAEEEPNMSPEPAYFLSDKMKGRSRILFNALGPDELFFGYGHHIMARKLKKILPALRMIPTKMLPTKKREKLQDAQRFGLAAIPFISRSIASWEEIKQLFAAHRSTNWPHPLEILLSQVRCRFPDFDRLPLMKQLSLLDIHYYISSYHSSRSDRPSMLNHIEMRFPYLDHHFFQKYFNLVDLDTHLTMSNTKPYFRKQLQNVVDPRILSMPKTGFNMPVHSWGKGISTADILSGLKNTLSAESINHFCTSNEKRWLLYSFSVINADKTAGS